MCAIESNFSVRNWHALCYMAIRCATTSQASGKDSSFRTKSPKLIYSARLTMRTFLMGCLIWLLTAVTGEAASLYVDGNLPATCSGTTYSVANRTCTGSSGAGYKTIPEALRALRASDTLYIRGGTYDYGGTVYGNPSSDTYGCKPTCPTSWSAATIMTNYPGETVDIKGLAFVFDGRNNVSYFIMQGETRSRFILEPSGTNCPNVSTCPGDDQALYVNASAHHLRFKSMTLRNWQGDAVTGGNSNISSSDICVSQKPTFIELIDLDISNNGNGDPVGRNEHAIYPSCGDSWTISGNHIVGSWGSGIHINSSNATNNFNALSNFTVTNNIIEGSRDISTADYCIVITVGTGHVVRNNLCIARGSQPAAVAGGIQIGIQTNSPPAVKSTLVENNTVYGTTDWCFQNYRADTVQWRNNLCNGPTVSFDVQAPSSNLTFQTNLCSTANAQAGSGCSVITSNAGFVSAGTNFHLGAGSLAINAGTTTSLTSDIEGRTRSQPFDIGAYEFGTTSVMRPPQNLRVQ